MMERLTENLGKSVSLKGPFPIYDRSRIDEAAPGFIITTARIDAFRKYNIPIIPVSPLITAEELEKIRQTLRQIRSKLQTLPLPQGKSQNISADHILTIRKKTDLPQAITLAEKKITEENVKSKSAPTNAPSSSTTPEYTISQLTQECLFLYTINPDPTTITSVINCPSGLTWRQNRGIKKVILIKISEKERHHLQAYYQYAKALALTEPPK